MMTQIFGSCGKYVQGYGAIHDLRKYVEWMGSSFLVVASKGRMRDLKDSISAALEGLQVAYFEFAGECSWKNIERIADAAKQVDAKTIIGVGGGKAIDAAKAAAVKCGLIHTVIIPTIAATDASTSAASCIYDDETHLMVGAPDCPKNPDLVLVDTEIILNAPVRQFVSGMGDALSTYIGGQVCAQNYHENYHGGVSTQVGLAIAKLSYDLLLRYGYQAKLAVEQRALTDAFNMIVEVNVLMSGLGFENAGSATDHAFFFGTGVLKNREHYCYHGEGVAFSTCCQLIMQGASSAQLDEVFRFCRDVGLPITFEDMHLPDLTEEELDAMSEAVANGKFTRNHPFVVTPEMAKGAYRTADAIGRLYHSGGSLL